MISEEQARQTAFDQFLNNHEKYLYLSYAGFEGVSRTMILFELCAALLLLNEEERDSFFKEIDKIKKEMSFEIFEDEADFLDCVSQIMDAVRDTE